MKSTKTTIRRKSQARAPSFSNALAGKQWLDEQKAAERKARKASKTPNAPTVPTRQVTTLGDLTRSVDKQAAKKAKKFVKKQAQNANTTSQHSSSGATGKNTTSSPTSGRLVPAKPPTKALGDRILIKRTGYHPVTGADDETDPAILALQARKRPNHPWTQQVKADDARMDAEDKAQHDAIVADGTLPTSLDISSIQLNFKQRGQAQEAESAVDTLAAASNEHPPPTSSTQDVAQVTSTGPQEGPETNWEDEHDLGCQKCRQAIGVFDQKTTLETPPILATRTTLLMWTLRRTSCRSKIPRATKKMRAKKEYEERMADNNSQLQARPKQPRFKRVAKGAAEFSTKEP